MGFNTIAFLDPDEAEQLKESPITTAAALYYNYSGSVERWLDIVSDTAVENNERLISGLSYPISWHASGSKYFMCDDSGVYQADWQSSKDGRLEDGTETIELVFNEKVCDGPVSIVFMLNDMLDGIRKNPKTVTNMLASPSESLEEWRAHRFQRIIPVAPGEQLPHLQAIEVFKANPPGETRYYKAGGNCVQACEFIKKGRKYTLLGLPTSDYDKQEHLMVKKLKALHKEKRLKEAADLTKVPFRDLQTYIRRSDIPYHSHKKLLPILEKF